MRQIITYLVFLILLFIALTSNAQMTVNQFYDSLNTLRQEQGIPPLKKSPILEIKAKNWISFLERHDMGMVHDTNTNDGEVLTNSDYFLQQWMASTPHRRVLMSKKYRKIGLAKKNGVYCARLN